MQLSTEIIYTGEQTGWKVESLQEQYDAAKPNTVWLLTSLSTKT